MGTVNLLLGCSSAALRGLHITPGVIDPDYEGEIKIMVSSPKGISVINQGDKIAQILVIPSEHDKYLAKKNKRNLGLDPRNL